MSSRIDEFLPRTPSAIIRHPRNWTGVVCFGSLSALHFWLAASALSQGGWEVRISASFGTIFAIIALLYFAFLREVAIYTEQRTIGVGWSIGPVAFERFVPYSEIECVRVILPGVATKQEPTVAIIARGREVELPPSSTPRQDALALAMVMNVRLVKIYSDPVPEPAKRIERLFGSRQSEDVKHDD